jgi:hypothetical protein
MDRKLNAGTPQEETGAKPRPPRIELNLPQVGGSALAAIAAAILASKLGVYGTIAGAGVVSVIATCGGSLFQHLFRRTGEQLREVTIHARPRSRQGPVRSGQEPLREFRRPLHDGGDPGDPGRGTRMLPQRERRDGEFGVATVHGTRARGWKRPVLAAVALFVSVMILITGYELIAGRALSGGKGTTVGSVTGGSGGGPGPSGSPSGPGQPGTGNPGDGVTTTPGPPQDTAPPVGAGPVNTPTPGSSLPAGHAGGSLTTPSGTLTPTTTPQTPQTGPSGDDSTGINGTAPGGGSPFPSLPSGTGAP